MEPLYGMLYLALSAMNAATWTPPSPADLATSAVPVITLTIPQPPTAFFRELLEARSQDRKQLLGRHSPAQQTVLLTQIQRYETMTRKQRDHQLLTLELRWYLAFLMRQSPSNRAMLLLSVPAPRRGLVDSRLVFWDRLSPEIQKDILENEMAIRMQYSLPMMQQTLAHLPSAQRQKILEDIARWEAMPVERKQKVYWGFQYLFELDDAPPPPLPDPGAMAVPGDPPLPVPLSQMFSEFKKLPSDDRVACLENFQRFTRLPPDQRTRFVKAAYRWSQMSESERNAWRRAVSDEASPPAPLPPMPDNYLPSESPRASRIPRVLKSTPSPPGLP
ncbi:MAG: DUF3106 domain-containing protein [Verrucomicrobia bacterium]|nr:DUF3106 domain-containing protein [Verrucomicrobiota bacterium]